LAAASLIASSDWFEFRRGRGNELCGEGVPLAAVFTGAVPATHFAFPQEMCCAVLFPKIILW
jgi:hypothetical protein